MWFVTAGLLVLSPHIVLYFVVEPEGCTSSHHIVGCRQSRLEYLLLLLFIVFHCHVHWTLVLLNWPGHSWFTYRLRSLKGGSHVVLTTLIASGLSIITVIVIMPHVTICHALVLTNHTLSFNVAAIQLHLQFNSLIGSSIIHCTQSTMKVRTNHNWSSHSATEDRVAPLLLVCHCWSCHDVDRTISYRCLWSTFVTLVVFVIHFNRACAQLTISLSDSLCLSSKHQASRIGLSSAASCSSSEHQTVALVCHPRHTVLGWLPDQPKPRSWHSMLVSLWSLINQSCNFFTL